MESSFKQKGNQVLDFERETRRIIEGVKAERRWPMRHKMGLLAKARKLIVYGMQADINFRTAILRWVDPWRTTPENVLEHTFKQTMLMMKMLMIEDAHGNPHKLNFYMLLAWAILHDLAEGEPDYYDMHYHVKRESKEKLEACRKKENEIVQRIMNNLFLPKYEKYFPVNVDVDSRVTQEEEKIWEASEKIGYNYFMLEEVRINKIGVRRKMRFHGDVKNLHIKWLKENAWHFASIREIVENELLPKWEAVACNVSRR